MLRFLIAILVIGLLLAGGVSLLRTKVDETPPIEDGNGEKDGNDGKEPNISNSSHSSPSFPSSPSFEVIATGLTVPWAIAFLPDGDLLVTERTGQLSRIGDNRRTYPVEGVRHTGEGGLLGIALHPDFEDNRLLYLYMTTQTQSGLRNRIERYKLEDDQLTERTEIFGDIPGAANHDGGALAFGPDGYLYVTTGDAQNEDLAQDTNSLAGKILRITEDGEVPSGNPFDNAVYSYGHRNPQGVAWDSEGRLWATEHGRSGVLSGYDELNLIERGANYGWPAIQGPETRDGMMLPILHSGTHVTWAPASAAFLDDKIFFGGLRGESLYEADITNPNQPVLKAHFTGTYGRIRGVATGLDGYLYVTTSNRDGRGSAQEGDDRILRINPALLQ